MGAIFEVDAMSGLQHTFGGSKAAETLVAKIGNDRKAISRVSVFFSDYNETMNTFEEMCFCNGHFWKNLLHLYSKDRFARSHEVISDEQGGSYLRNLMTIKKRRILCMLDDIIKIERSLKRKQHG